MTDQPDDLMDLAEAVGVTGSHPLADLERDCADIANLFEWLADFDPKGGTQ